MRTSFVGRVVRFHGGAHREVQDLLPWYLAGRLEAGELETVKTHLSVCADCQGEVRFQRRLGDEIAQMPMDVEQGWARMRRQIEDETPQRAPQRAPQRVARPAARPGTRWSPPAWLGGGALAGAGALAWRNSVPLSGGLMAGALMAVTVVMIAPFGQAGRYHALSSGPVASAGNVMVIFRPDTPEHSLREALRASHARVVGGPTDADAYVLAVPTAERDAALSSLRARTDILVAQPIDPGGDR